MQEPLLSGCLFLTNLLPEIVMAESRLLIQTKAIPL